MPTDQPRFVPTLTEVVTPEQVRAPLQLDADDAAFQDELAEQIAHRVLQRVDALLEERLAAVIRAVVARHTQELLPALREEIVVTVQATVAEALADELIPPEAGRHG